MKQLPQHDSLLANMKIDFQDIEETIKWYERIKALIEEHNKKAVTDGRNCQRLVAFGYTPLLSRFAQNISASISGRMLTAKLAAHESALEQMMKNI